MRRPAGLAVNQDHVEKAGGSVLPYYLLLLAVAALGVVLCEWKPTRKKEILFLCLAMAAMALMASLRAKTVGIDYKMYADYFQSVAGHGFDFLFSPENAYRIEFGFGLLNFLISRFSGNTYVFMAVIAVLTIGLRALAIARQSSSVWLSVFTFVSFGFFGYTMCTLRQEMAISIFLFAIPYLQKKRPVPYFLLVLLAASFHKSVLILLPVYFLAHIPVNWKSLTFYGAATGLLLIFSRPIINFVTQFVYQFYTQTEQGRYYLMGRDAKTALIPVAVFAAAYFLRKRLLDRNPHNVVLINFSMYAALLFIMTIKHFVFQRIALIFLPITIFLLPEMVKSMQVDEEKLGLLEEMKKSERGKKKQNFAKAGQLRTEIRDQRAMYYAAIGFVLVIGLVYYSFLLYANRLLLVPYATLF